MKNKNLWKKQPDLHIEKVHFSKKCSKKKADRGVQMEVYFG